MKNRVFTGRLAGWASIAGFAVSLGLMSGCSKPDESSFLLKPSSRSAEYGAEQRSFERVVLRGVEFRPDGSIRLNSKQVLDTAVDFLKGKPNAIIYVDAYCDPSGGRRLNQRLSDKHAATVASYLEEHGVQAAHIVPRGFGASHFVADNATASGRSQNRRIELIVETDVTG